MAEYIERNDVLRAIYKYPDWKDPQALWTAVRKIPAADVVPTVHAKLELRLRTFEVDGYWEAEEYEMCCTNCGAIIHSPELNVQNFCSHCGAKIDEVITNG